MSRRLRRATAAALLTLLTAAGTGAAAASDESPSPTSTPTSTPNPSTDPTSTPTSTPDTDRPFTVDDAQLRWGVNDESNNRAFAPGTYNFLSAGVVPDPGGGGNTVANGVWSSTGAPAWSAGSGAVAIEKRQPDGSYAPATFAGLSTQADGTALGSPTAGTFSGHQVVIDGGTGTVDPRGGTATIAWSGSFSVLFYSGMSFFTVTDPRLEVTASTATLTADVAGYASSMDDTSVWGPVAARRVVLADLPRASLVLPTQGGFTATPGYLQVPYDSTGAAQVRTGASWGSFPTSFVDQQTRVGAAAYWYSSGGSTDAWKVAKPLTISYSAGAPIPVAAEPGAAAGTSTTKKTPKAPSAPTPPAAPTSTSSSPTADPTGTTTTTRATPPVPVALAAPAPGEVAVAAPTTYDPRLPTVPVVYALASSPRSSGTDPDHHHWEWWLGALLLLGAAGLSLSTHRPTRSRGTS